MNLVQQLRDGGVPALAGRIAQGRHGSLPTSSGRGLLEESLEEVLALGLWFLTGKTTTFLLYEAVKFGP